MQVMFIAVYSQAWAPYMSLLMLYLQDTNVHSLGIKWSITINNDNNNTRLMFKSLEYNATNVHGRLVVYSQA